MAACSYIVPASYTDRLQCTIQAAVIPLTISYSLITYCKWRICVRITLHWIDCRYLNKVNSRKVCLFAVLTFAVIVLLCSSSFKHLIGGLEDVSSKGHEDADAKAK